MKTAHKLMRRYNVDAAPGQYGFRHLGAPTGRIPGHHRILAGILGQHFFVQPIWVFAWQPDKLKRGRILEICGRQENLEIAAHVHGFVLQTSERLWKRHRKTKKITGNRDRRIFLQGVMMGLHEQLASQAQECEETGLVWVGDPDLVDYVARRHPRQVSSRGGRGDNSAAYAAGKRAGRRLVVHRPIRSEGESRGRLLPG